TEQGRRGVRMSRRGRRDLEICCKAAHSHPIVWQPRLRVCIASDGAGRVAFARNSIGGKRMDIVTLIIQLLSGAAGGNLAGNVAKDMSLGPVGNTIAGAIGGGLGGQILSALLGLAASRTGGLDIGAIVGQIIAGGASG